jgi:DNA repair exonuclease SbcCD ATPase subunit
MWLKRIELKNFKRLVDFQAQFHPGINVVKGPLNEMGKSTLLEGIVVALFHNPKSTAKWLKDYVSWGSTRQCRTTLEFEDNGTGYLLEKDFDKGNARLTSGDGREEFDTFKKISEKMAELLGTNSDKLFSYTSCIRQAEVRAISSGEKEIGESLEEVVTGGKESALASEIIQKLDDKVSEMKKGLDRPAKIPGILANLKNKLQDTSRRYDEIKDEVSKVEVQKIELMEVNKQLIQVKEEYEKSKSLLEKNKRRKEVEASIENLKQKYSEVGKQLDKIKMMSEKSATATRELRSIVGLEDEQCVMEFRRRLNEIQIRRNDIENSLKKLQEEITEAEERLDKRKFLRFLSLRKNLVIAAIISTGGLVGTLIGPLYLLSLMILGMAFLATGMWARGALASDRTEIFERTGRVQKMNKTLGELSEDEKKTLSEAGCSTIDEYNKRENDFKYWLNEQRNLQNQLMGMLAGRTIEDMEEQRQEIARGLAIEEAKLTDDLTETRVSPEDYIELEKKVRDFEEKQTELEDRKKYDETVIKLAKEKGVHAEKQTKLEEELDDLKEALKQEEKRVKIYELAREYISQARAETFLSANEILEKEIQNYFSVFTNGKYKQVQIDKEGLEFQVYSEEKGDWAKPEELSGGAIDEFYLACRLALVKLIFQDKRPPLILDDPFVNFDSVRLANTLNFFKMLTTDYQIIIFTLSDLYDKVADNIILLGGIDRALQGGD